ncbi:GntP family permease [Rhodococcus sp. IEGM1428]|uniref:GntP family permease n=1 Tax=Rhodococcus sp. IEGM1428 TaxID=3392191 RepID=UPI003D14F06E
MTGNWIVLHLLVAVAIVIGLIVRVKMNPTLALILGSIYLGIAGGLGFGGTAEAITTGFGELMAELGLLIGFGLLLGSLLQATGVLQALVRKLLRSIGPRRLPYALGLALCTIFPSVYPDVQFVLAAPLIRDAASESDRHHLPRMAAGMLAGGLVGLAMVVPGIATVAIAGILGISLGSVLVYGFVLGPVTVLIATFFSCALLDRIWNPDTDTVTDDVPPPLAESLPTTDNPGGTASHAQSGTGTGTVVAGPPRQRLWTSLVPTVLLPVLLIAAGTIVDVVAGEVPPVVGFLSNPTIALLIGLLVAYVIARRSQGTDRVEAAIGDGLKRAGSVLLVTGAGGAFGTVVAGTDIAVVVSKLFSNAQTTNSVLIVLLAWTVAALAHLGVGSISVAAITATGIIAPSLVGGSVPLVLVALAIGSGSLFAVHINSNGFWLIRSLLGLTTSGAFKINTLVSSIASVVALILVTILAVAL